MNLYVSNLSPDTTESELRDVFSEFGAIVSARVIRDIPTGVSKGFGFVEMADKQVGYDAIDNLDGSFFMGNIIIVKPAKQNNERSSGQSNTFRKKPGYRSDNGFNTRSMDDRL